MTPDLLAPGLSAVLLIIVTGALGLVPIRRLIRIYEAKHELRHGSAGWLRSLSGWSIIVIWLLATCFFAKIIGDWGATGDLEGAIDRSIVRLRILVEIGLALMESD